MDKSNSSILNKSNISLQRAKQNLSGLKTALNTSPISPFRSTNKLITSKNSYIISNSSKSIPQSNALNNNNNNNINIDGLISPINNEIINNNQIITGNNVELSNKLSYLMGTQIINNDNKKINELTSYCNYFEALLKNSNDYNTEKLNSYEKLNIRIKDTIIDNNKIEKEIKEYENENIDIAKLNDELRRNLSEINKRFEDENEILKNYFSLCNQNYNEVMEKKSFLTNLNKNLVKSKSDYNELINKMKETITILSNKKNSQSLDLRQIEKKLFEKDEQLEKKENQLKELQNINEQLLEEGKKIQEEINDTLDQITNHQQLSNQLINIKEQLNESKIEELKNIIRKKDREIEEIKSNYNDINKKLKRRKIGNSDYETYKFKRNEVQTNKNNYKKDYNKYTLNKIDNNNIRNRSKFDNKRNDLSEIKNSLKNIYDEEINKIEENEEIFNERKNHSQKLLEENKKLQQEYLNLIEQSLNLGKVDKRYENNKIWNDLNEIENNKNAQIEEEENLNKINDLYNAENNLDLIEEEQKDDKTDLTNDSSPIMNLPLQLSKSNEEIKEKYNEENKKNLDDDVVENSE